MEPLTPTIGRIVIIRDPSSGFNREFPAIISRVLGSGHTPCINAHVCYDDGMRVTTSIQHASIVGASVTWDWPVRV